MLQAKRDLSFRTDGSNGLRRESFTEIYTSFVGFLRRQLKVFCVLIVCTTMLGLLYLFTTPPSFTASALLVIDTRKVQSLQQPSGPWDNTIDVGMVQTQVEILRSQNVSISVINKLGLTTDPEFVGSKFVGSTGLLDAAVTLAENLLGFDERQSEPQRMRRALVYFESRRKVSRVGQTYVMEITFRSLDPAKAARIADAIANAYITDSLDAKYQTARRASLWFLDRLKELSKQVSAAEQAVVDFKRAHDIVAVKGGTSNGQLVNDQQLSEVNTQLMLARAATAEAKARLDRIQNVMLQGVPDASVADALHNEIIIRLRKDYLDTSARERIIADRYGTNHLAAVNLRTQMVELRRNITDEMQKIAESYKSDYEIALAREQSLTGSLANKVSESNTKDQDLIQLRELESNAQSYRTIYENFLHLYQESVQQQTFQITEERLIAPALPPVRKSDPNTLLVLAISGAAGLMLSFGVAIYREVSDRVFHSGSEIQKVLGVNCIATLPALKLAKTPDRIPPKEDAPKTPRTITYEDDFLRFVVDSPFAQFTEGFRSLKVVVDLNGELKPNKVIGVTSTLQNEGKSTVASNFAHLIAHAGESVILIDCDLRDPSLSRRLSADATVGLVDVIKRKKEFTDVIWTEPSTGLIFLPAGNTSKLVHTNRILASNEMRKLIDNLRGCFDYVVVDFSPLAPVVDARATTKFIDSYVYVVEWGRTKMDIVEDTLIDAGEIHDRLLGVIINKADMNAMARYKGYATRYAYGNNGVDTTE